ncbi:hypothetical protein PVAP13_7NG361150 [Panicum virgatum]|uniref:Exonuclease domain-containing protein n=1 Tax=Panicum virgatum TaxID=38727 RepID=A0A8T0Q813_PANVG|nr:hypothetical protein PVAP13_7NG361150 [Panicum virgatum]
MSLVLRFNLLRNNIWSSCPVRFLKQHTGFSYEKLLQPGSYEKRHFTTKLTETASLHKTHSASCIPAISPLWLQQTSERDQPATILVFDIETTGFLHADHRIIEFALRDLSGGENCTFETLINPERNVPKYAAEANKITTELVRRCTSNITSICSNFKVAKLLASQFYGLLTMQKNLTSLSLCKSSNVVQRKFLQIGCLLTVFV